jgi:hypothetical protein
MNMPACPRIAILRYQRGEGLTGCRGFELLCILGFREQSVQAGIGLMKSGDSQRQMTWYLTLIISVMLQSEQIDCEHLYPASIWFSSALQCLSIVLCKIQDSGQIGVGINLTDIRSSAHFQTIICVFLFPGRVDHRWRPTTRWCIGFVPLSSHQLPGCQGNYSIIFCDNCSCHCSHDVLRDLATHETFLMTYPPHSSHIFQVLDVLLFGRLKSAKNYLARNESRW